MKTFILVLCCFFLNVVFASAETLSWDACVMEARKNHPDLISAREKLNAAKADKALTRSGTLPQLTANAGADTGKTQGKVRSEAYSYGVSGRQLLFDGFKISNDLAAAQEKIKTASFNYQVVSSNVRLHLWTAFVGLLSAQENLSVTKNISDRRQQNLGMVQLQYQSGREHKGSLLTAEANVAQAQLDMVEARRNVELYQRRLVKELGRAKFTEITAGGELTLLDIDRTKPVFEKLVETTPLLKELVTQKEAAKYGLKSAKSDFFPQVYADAGAVRNDSAWPPQTGNWSAGISVSFPIFQGGQQEAALSKAQASYRQSQADERSGRDGVILTLAETWTQWLNDVDQSAVQGKFFEAARQRADIVEAQYKSGLATFNDWTIIEDDLVRNQKSLLQAKTNALLSEASWLQAKGETVDE
ncbi:MAG: TolC family protein [Candidatus Omnitrophica bacterium]|nr:TolC family protein [Candidatus Omnitrophota bacterium]